jgi:hypothetical protein
MSKSQRRLHLWRNHYVLQNWQVCANCSLQRRKAKDGKYYYDSKLWQEYSKTYCTGDKAK